MQKFIEYDVLSFERIAFAHTLSVQNYHYDLVSQGYGIYGDTPSDGGVLEVGFVEQNPLVITSVQDPECSFTVPEYGVFILPPGYDFHVQSESDGLHRHSSVEFLIRSRIKEVAAANFAHGSVFTAPFFLPPSKENAEILKAVRAIVDAKTSLTKKNYFEESRDFMGLVALLSQRVAETGGIDPVSPGNRRHCSRAKAYISAHLSEHIRVNDIAEALGISKNYLTNIFSESEGISLIEYINRLKLSRMTELMRKFHYTIAEAGEMVGFSDANYVSRIFPKYFGMTVSEYKRRWSLED